MNYEEREGIRLDISQIAKNPGRKATAKLMLNRYVFFIFYFLFFMLYLHSSHPFFLFIFLVVFGGSSGRRATDPPL